MTSTIDMQAERRAAFTKRTKKLSASEKRRKAAQWRKQVKAELLRVLECAAHIRDVPTRLMLFGQQASYSSANAAGFPQTLSRLREDTPDLNALKVDLGQEVSELPLPGTQKKGPQAPPATPPPVRIEGDRAEGDDEEGESEEGRGEDDDDLSLPEIDKSDLPASPREQKLNRVKDLITASELAKMQRFPHDDRRVLEFVRRRHLHLLWADMWHAEELGNGDEAIREWLGEGQAEDVEELVATVEDTWVSDVLNDFKRELQAVRDYRAPRDFEADGLKLSIMQRLYALRAKEHKRYGNWSSPGGGKTVAAILGALEHGARHIFLVCPNSVRASWVRALKRHVPAYRIYDKEDFEGGRLPRMSAKTKAVVLINYEWFRDSRHADVTGFDAVIFDEAHNIKRTVLGSASGDGGKAETESQRRKWLIEQLRLLSGGILDKHIAFLTGTALKNDAREAWSITELIDGEHNVTRARCGNSYLDRMEAYIDIHRTGIRYVAEFPVELVRTQVYSNEPLPARAKELRSLRARLRLLESVLAKLPDGDRAVVFTRLVKGVREPALEVLQRLFPGQVMSFTGDDKMSSEALKEFNAASKYRVLLLSQRGGEGVDGLQHAANRIIFLYPPHTAATYEQAVARLRRHGQTRTVYCTDLVCATDYDMRAQERLVRKQKLTDFVLDGKIEAAPEVDLNAAVDGYRARLDQLGVKYDVYETLEFDPYRLEEEDEEPEAEEEEAFTEGQAKQDARIRAHTWAKARVDSVKRVLLLAGPTAKYEWEVVTSLWPGVGTLIVDRDPSTLTHAPGETWSGDLTVVSPPGPFDVLSLDICGTAVQFAPILKKVLPETRADGVVMTWMSLRVEKCALTFAEVNELVAFKDKYKLELEVDDVRRAHGIHQLLPPVSDVCGWRYVGHNGTAMLVLLWKLQGASATDA